MAYIALAYPYKVGLYDEATSSNNTAFSYHIKFEFV